MRRRELLFGVWQKILTALDREIAGVSDLLPLPSQHAKGYALKAFEDRLDAVICCWVGACALMEKAQAYGDDTSAIWIPRRPVTSGLKERVPRRERLSHRCHHES